jgi:nicotinamidase-related amidase
MAEPPKKAATKANAAKQEADTGVAAPKAGGGVMKKGKHVGDKAAKKKEKDLNSPKKPVAGAYGVFLAANREAIKKTLPADHKITDVAKAAGTQWAAVSDTEKMPYQMQYDANVVAYKKAMEEGLYAVFKAGGGVMEKKRKRLEEAAKMKEKDSNSPKKPVGGAYGIYLAANREAIKKALPADHKITDVAKAAGTKLAAVSDTEKMRYHRQYDANVAAYKKAMEEKVAASPPKKPVGGAYGIYLAANREAIKKALPADHKITDVAKAVGTKWAAVSDTEKMPYQRQYDANVAAYKKAMEEKVAASPAKKAKTESPKAAPKAKGKAKGKAKLVKN